MSLPNARKGECEGFHPNGDNQDIPVYQMPHGLWLCKECREKEIAAITEQERTTNKIITDARQADASIQLKQDLFNAPTVAAIQILAAIEADDTIPADQKQYRYTKELETRYLALKKVVFDKRKDLLKDENEMRLWLLRTQEAAGKLREDQREYFQKLGADVSYPAVKPKTIKSKKIKVGKARKHKFSAKELKEASVKYNVPMAGVEAMAVARNMSADEAAKTIVEMMAN